jgi:uncharacterized protein YaiI (UPF0178 family)
MQIWVDADACPNIIKDILFRAAKRTQINVILVANQPLNTPISPYIQKLVVGAGFDVADKKIIQSMQAGDIVITADIPLANDVVEKGGTALNPRGEQYTVKNIKHHLSIRNFAENLRSSGVITGGPATLSKKEIQTFANCLDRLLNAFLSR